MNSLLGIHHDARPWYLIQCQGRKESYAVQSLKMLLGITAFFPEYRVKSNKGIQYASLFPGYIFAQVNLQTTSLSQINACPGVLRLVGFGGDPQSVPAEVVYEIAERTQHFNELPVPFKPGDLVRMKHTGSLQVLEMVFMDSTTSNQRVWVLLNLLGCQHKVSVDMNMLEKIPGMPAISIPRSEKKMNRQRYTRGKGRKIKRMYQRSDTL